jgi:hypothetical protein
VPQTHTDAIYYTLQTDSPCRKRIVIVHCIDLLNILINCNTTFSLLCQHNRFTECDLVYEYRTQYGINVQQEMSFNFALTFKNLKFCKYAILICFNTMLFKRPCTKPGPVCRRYSPCIYFVIIGWHGGRHATSPCRSAC